MSVVTICFFPLPLFSRFLSSHGVKFQSALSCIHMFDVLSRPTRGQLCNLLGLSPQPQFTRRIKTFQWVHAFRLTQQRNTASHQRLSGQKKTGFDQSVRKCQACVRATFCSSRQSPQQAPRPTTSRIRSIPIRRRVPVERLVGGLHQLPGFSSCIIYVVVVDHESAAAAAAARAKFGLPVESCRFVLPNRWAIDVELSVT